MKPAVLSTIDTAPRLIHASLLVLGFTLMTAKPLHGQSILVEDGFAGAAGALPDATKFAWSGQLAQSGSGQLSLSTNTTNQSWLRSIAAAAPGAGETLVLQLRAYAYAEGGSPGVVYGDKQPRGLRVGGDANNAVEFYSASRTSVGMRLRKDGVESLASYALPSGVDSMHDYEISVTPTVVSFKVDGTTAATFTSNIPTAALNAYVSTHDGGAGNVPVSIDSLSLVLTGSAGTEPAITGQPASVTADANATATFSVTATGTAPLSYQWRKDEVDVDGATAATLTLPNVQASQAGNYRVVVTNDFGSATSDVAVLTVNRLTQTIDFGALADRRVDDAPFALAATASSDLTVSYVSSNTTVATVTGNTVTLTGTGQTTLTASQAGDATYLPAAAVSQTLLVTGIPPAITGQPASVTADANATATFSVTATGTAPLSYQWRKDEVDVDGATAATLTLPNVQASQAGNYRVVVTNDWGSTTSEMALLTVNRLTQTIDFGALPAKWVDDAPFPLGATASSGLAVSYSSSNPAVATVSDNTVTIKGSGETTLTASQTGNATYLPAEDASQILRVSVMPGAVTAWGSNNDGQATAPDNLSGVTAIAAGLHHTVALKSDGTVVAWGLNGNGQTSVPAGLSGVTAIAAGYFHTVALKSDGTVAAWGYNSNGQASVPAGLSGVTAIAAGYYHTVALKSNGTVVAWGYNGDGQTTVPADLTGVTAIAAGSGHTVALKSNGTVVAWGYNLYGQASVPSGLSGVTAVAAGGYHTLALKADHTVAAWGYNLYGQKTVPAGLSEVTAIAAGYFHSVALKSDGTVAAWGANSSGQANVPAGLNKVTAIAAGAGHTVVVVPAIPVITVHPASATANACATASLSVSVTGTAPFSYQWRKDGVDVSGATSAILTFDNVQTSQAGSYTVVVTNACGSTTSNAALLTVNRLAQTVSFAPLADMRVDDPPLTLGATATSGLPVSYTSSNPAVATVNGNVLTITGGGGTTITASQPGNASYLSASASRTLRVAGLPGVVVAWGNNSAGQRTVPAGLIDATAVAAGGLHTLALKSDGTVVAWGSNNYGQAGVPAGLSGVTAIAAGAYHSVALKSDGTVVAWGYNNYGQINVPAGLSGVTAIAAGAYHSVALKSNGTVVAWGYNNYGQTSVPAGLSGVTAVAAGYSHTAVVRDDGELTVWGYYLNYALANATVSGVAAASGGDSHSVVLKADGTVAALGYNNYGQTNVPAGLTGVRAVAAGGGHSVALKADGTVVAWGYNNSGQTSVPAGLNEVAAIAAGGSHTVALVVVKQPTISGFAPVSGPVGTSVTLHGTGFTRATGVKFNGTAAVFSVVSDEELVATVPGYAASGAITLTNPTGLATGPEPFTVAATEVGAATEAALDAALAASARELVFTCDGTLVLTTTKVIAADLTLDGAGHNLTLSGNNTVRVLTVNPGVTLTLRNLTIANGNSLTLGGGIYNNGGNLTAVDCGFTNNTAVGDVNAGAGAGGAIYNNTNGTLNLTNCTFAGNRATGGTGVTGIANGGSNKAGGTGGTGGPAYGGGIYNNGGNVALTNCTLNGNQATGGAGGTGGRGFDGYQYLVDVSWPGTDYWVTVYGGPGGQGGSGGNGFGASLANASGTMTLLNVTLARGAAGGGAGGAPGAAGNYASGSYGPGPSGSGSQGGNLHVAAGSVAVRNTIIAYGTGNSGNNCAGTVTDNGNNICSDATAGFTAAGSSNNKDPLLAASLAANGGSTLTVALLSQSPAINAGDDAAAPLTDQRHYPRSGRSDLGSCEFQIPVVSGFTATSGPPGTSVAIQGTNFYGITAVRFGGAEATFTHNSPVLITAVVPAYATTGVLTVVSNNGTGSSTTEFVVQPLAPIAPLTAWLFANGLPADADLQADPNNDGVNLLLAYALNLEPDHNLSGSLPRPVFADNHMSLTFYAGSEGVTYAVEASTDLQHWTTDGVTLSAPDANKFRTATVERTGKSRFLRLVVGH